MMDLHVPPELSFLQNAFERYKRKQLHRETVSAKLKKALAARSNIGG